jgi:MFS family permease
VALAGGDRLGTVWTLDGLEVTIVGAIASRLTIALAFFYAVGTGIGGVTGPALFGKLVETGEEVNVFYGYLLGAVLMIAAGILEWFIGVEAAGRSLEDAAKPLTAHEEEAEAPA